MRARILSLDGWFNEKSDYLDTVLFTQLKPSTIIVTRGFLNLVRSWIQARLISQEDTKSNYYLHTIAETIYEITTMSLLLKEFVWNVLWPSALLSTFGIHIPCVYLYSCHDEWTVHSVSFSRSGTFYRVSCGSKRGFLIIPVPIGSTPLHCSYGKAVQNRPVL